MKKNTQKMTHNIQEYFFWPGTSALKRYINDIQIVNCSVTAHDVIARDSLYGKPKPLLKGKMIRTCPQEHIRNNMLPLFDLISNRYKDLHIFMDLFFVNGNIFLHTKSENINYRSVQSSKTKRSMEVAKGLTIVK